MTRKNFLVILIVMIVSIAMLCMAQIHVDNFRSDYAYRLHVAALPLPIEMIKAIAGEFKGMFANYFLLEAASFIGSKQSINAGPEEWSAVARLLEQSSNLDPYFKNTYRLTQSALPWETQQYNETIAILERSKRHRSWDWEPGFFIGFDYYFFLRDNLTASQKLMEAAEIKNAPEILFTLASRLASQAGHTRTAIEFLEAMMEKVDDEKIKKTLEQRILALKGVEVLQSAVDRFRVQFNRIPDSLDELVDKSILPSLPVNPYDHPFTLKNGQVDF